MDKLAAMRVFVEIVDRGSLTAAAEASGRSQPSVVRTLAALEAHLGARLLRRTTRRMSLTPEGRDYLERCRRILADVDDAELAVGQNEAEPRGDLRITAPVQFGQLHMVSAISDFLSRYEHVRVDLLLLDRVVDLVDEGIDLALRIGPLADSSMTAIRVGEVRRVVCASPALLERVGVPDHPRALSQLPCIRLRNLSSTSTWPFRDSGHDVAIRVGGRLSCNHIAAGVAACAEGVGFGQFLSYQVQQFISEKKLCRVLEDFEPEPLPVHLVYPGGRLVSTRLRALINALKDSLRNSEALW
ncbi:LysR family transcriptional regulator [Microbulbifer sp. SH-1]|uniref:LysR family transcriptional regulator n=1 Tax=Microbulbifer sp. SH-1 TaxID=2681547 RepID=UPI001407C91E|nr:LysR family transcriptional regulator [Microbulbifer sp. SH-1]QIL89288.1 LysR family transcriptional regulator [Microbulbifer sp. SH-1]